MMSEIPAKFEKVSPEKIDQEILRAAIIAELDAVNLYEQMAASAKSEILKKVLYDIAKEEKTHVGEFQALLLDFDKEQTAELKKGAEEVKELASN